MVFLLKKRVVFWLKKLILRIYDRFFEFSPYLEWFLNKISGKFGSYWLYWKHELLTSKVFLGNRPLKCVLELIVIGKYLFFRLWKSSEHTPHFNMEYDCRIFSKCLIFQMKNLVFQSKYLVFRFKTLDFDRNTRYFESKILKYYVFPWFFRPWIWNTKYFERNT